MAHRVRGRGLVSCRMRARLRRRPWTDPWVGGLLVISLGHHVRGCKRTPAGEFEGASRALLPKHASKAAAVHGSTTARGRPPSSRTPSCAIGGACWCVAGEGIGREESRRCVHAGERRRGAEARGCGRMEWGLTRM
jgi:hypothetical protein